MESIPIQRALISVSDKLGLGGFARSLVDRSWKSTAPGGTARHLENEGIDVLDVSAYTGFPEMMDGRLKTLHPKIFGGILCRRNRDDDMAAMAEHGIVPFELVVVNLYPFEATVAREGVTLEEAIEQIDIGGPEPGAGRGQEPRVRGHCHAPRAVLVDPGGGLRRTAARRWSCGSGWPPRLSPTRPATTGRLPTTLPVWIAARSFLPRCI